MIISNILDIPVKIKTNMNLTTIFLAWLSPLASTASVSASVICVHGGMCILHKYTETRNLPDAWLKFRYKYT